jgi:Mlc titration factor MtfA (ptsG expression regulator)
MFDWLANRRRKKLTQALFPSSWEAIIRRNVAHCGMLNEVRQAHLRALTQVFIVEKNWEGAGGLELADEIRVTISDQACLLLLGLPHDFYRNVDSIIVYPSTVIPPQRDPGFFEHTVAPVAPEHPILGQAFRQGPVIIIWDAALRGGRHPDSGHNVVYHEFAHKLDMLVGAAAGKPPLCDRAEYRDWVLTCSREYLRLKRDTEKGKKSFLDAYGATSEAEFFAVTTEQFFDQPRSMQAHAPDLYRVLQEYYRQDPAKRVARNNCKRESSSKAQHVQACENSSDHHKPTKRIPHRFDDDQKSAKTEPSGR